MPTADAFDVTGRRVLVTGSSRGIGLGIATELRAAGARVTLHGRDQQALAAAAEEIDAPVVTGDLRDADQARDAVLAAVAAFDGLDAVVHSAGGSFVAAAVDLSARAFNAVVTTNLTAAFLVATAAFEHLERTGGSIVNISSVAAIRPSPQLAPYSAAKAGLNQLTGSLAAEWAGSGVRVNAVMPGIIATRAALSANYDDDPVRIAAAERRVGVGRLGRSDDVAHACRYLISPAAGFVNGATLVLDGGPPGASVV